MPRFAHAWLTSRASTLAAHTTAATFGFESERKEHLSSCRKKEESRVYREGGTERRQSRGERKNKEHGSEKRRMRECVISLLGLTNLQKMQSRPGYEKRG